MADGKRTVILICSAKLDLVRWRMGTLITVTIPHHLAVGCRVAVLEPQSLLVKTLPTVTYTRDLYSSYGVLQWLCRRSLEAETEGDLMLTWTMSEAYRRRRIKRAEDWCEFPVGFWMERLLVRWGVPCGFGAMVELSGLLEDPHVLCRLL